MSTICKTCGATVSDDETHCPYCDSPIESDKHSHKDSPTKFESYESNENQEDFSSSSPQDGFAKKSIGFIFLFMLICVLVNLCS